YRMSTLHQRANQVRPDEAGPTADEHTPRRFYGVGTQTCRHGRRYSKAGSVMAIANLVRPPSVPAHYVLALDGAPSGRRCGPVDSVYDEPIAANTSATRSAARPSQS